MDNSSIAELPTEIPTALHVELEQEYGHIIDIPERIHTILRASVPYRRTDPRLAYKYVLYASELAERNGDTHAIAHVCYALFVYKNDLSGISDLALLEKALYLFTQHNDQLMMLKIRHAKACYYFSRGECEAALALCVENRRYLEESGQHSEIQNVLYLTGIIFTKIGRLVESLQVYDELISGLEQRGEGAKVPMYYGSIAAVFSQLGEYEKAISYSLKGLDYYSGNSIALAIALRNTGEAYNKALKTDEALHYFTRAYDMMRALGNTSRCADILGDIGMIYATRNEYEMAMEYYQQALVMLEQSHDLRYSAYLFANIYRVYFVWQQYEDACVYAEKARNTAKEYGIKTLQYEMLHGLAEAKRLMGNPSEALDYFQQYMQMKEEVLDEEKQKAIAEMQAKFDVETAEREKELFRVKNAELSAALDEVRRLNDNLTKVNNEKNEVLGIVAHDLKSPLSGVRMVASLVKDHYRRMPAEELEHQLDIIVDSTERMLSISSGLLKAQQIETGDVYGTSARVNVSEVVSRIAEDYRAAAKAKQIGIDVQCEADVELVCSEEALRQAVENVVSNAVKFTPPGKQVHVRVKKSKTKILIEVQDEGPGIGKLEKRKLYGKYSRLSARPTGGESSTGLGLWIAKRAVEALHGRIRCASALGNGTMFAIEIPVTEVTRM